MKSDKLCLHAGGAIASLADLQAVPMPEQTNTYVPVGHYDLAMNIQQVADDLLRPKGYEFDTAQYALAREGQRVFGLFRYKNGHTEMGLAVGWRNSYDKSMSAAVAIGAQVFVCDNLAIHGDITIMRKHTKNVKAELVGEIIQALYNASTSYKEFQALVDKLKTIEVPDKYGWKLLGILSGMGVLSPTLFTEAMRQWNEPAYPDFVPRTGWSLYNAITCALREAPPNKVFEAHRTMHDVVCIELGLIEAKEEKPVNDFG